MTFRIFLDYINSSCACMRAQSCPALCNPMYLVGPIRLLFPWDFPDKNTGVGSHFLLQGILPIQGLNLHLLSLPPWQVDSLPLELPGKWLDYIFLVQYWFRFLKCIEIDSHWQKSFFWEIYIKMLYFLIQKANWSDLIYLPHKRCFCFILPKNRQMHNFMSDGTIVWYE